MTGRDRLAIFPAISAAGLFLPDVALSSHGKPGIESLLIPADFGGSSFFRLPPELQDISAVGVVEPKARAEVTDGGEDVPVARSER